MACGGGVRTPCGACKFLRRKCVKGCVFAPYFSSEDLGASEFSAIHKIFGASNFSKLLQNIPSEEERYDAVASISYEAQSRLQDPIFGCVSHIFSLQRQVAHLQDELRFAQARLACSSERASLSPHQLDHSFTEIPASSNDSPYGHYCSPNEMYSSHQSPSQNTTISSDNNDAFFPIYIQEYCQDHYPTAQQINVYRGQ
ncbi:hypothetical protein SUGI_0858950 [Cryptomeria japonica]|uniref:LOB domain-containing protein 14-like n=1 Tax=Cryptomeria japonica TaxID=3369 RepID=UPI0024149158|nr:LOB domain-containing protein 14-like [Cryptomeria japonica]GLJ41493.1 hypothetical protein SUGI_0858950 [Cryptomeria japonica]